MSSHPQQDPLGGGNPNYHAETAHTQNPGPPSELAGSAPASQFQQSASPPGDQQQHYPPPPGPPPEQFYQSGEHHSHHLDASSSAAPPPGYEHHDQPHVQFAGDQKPPVAAAGGDDHPPAMPARPVSSANTAQPPPYFPGPPGSEKPQATGHAGQAGHLRQSSLGSLAPGGSSPTGKEKKGFGARLYQWGIKAGVPINKLTNKLGSEAFWPTSLDKECDKAARILKSFCKDGFYTNDSNQPPPSPSGGRGTSPGPSGKARVLVKIPSQAIAEAKGLAIFTTFRTGLHISGAGGSGVVLARLPDGSWSPPSGFLVHTLGAGFLVGLDIYDCVCVLRTDEAVRAFTHPRLSLGGELSVVAGPVGAGASVEGAVGRSSKPVWSYMKSRGFYAGVQADGTVVIERPDANAAFYGRKVKVDDILRGEVGTPTTVPTGPAGDVDADGNLMWPRGAHQLFGVLAAAEGKKVDESVWAEVGTGPTPGDLAGTEGLGQKEHDMKAGVHYG